MHGYRYVSAAYWAGCRATAAVCCLPERCSLLQLRPARPMLICTRQRPARNFSLRRLLLIVALSGRQKSIRLLELLDYGLPPSSVFVAAISSAAVPPVVAGPCVAAAGAAPGVAAPARAAPAVGGGLALQGHGRAGKWQVGQVAGWASGRVGKWQVGQVAGWASGRVGKWVRESEPGAAVRAASKRNSAM